MTFSTLSVHQQICLIVNIVGALAVLGGYGVGVATHQAPSTALWGGVPTALRGVYGISMLGAAVGYVAAAYFVIFRLDSSSTKMIFGLGYSSLTVAYVVVLSASAFWMPLTFQYVAAPSEALWLAIRCVLFAVGFAALYLTIALWTLSPRPAGYVSWLATLGATYFCAHTLILDAIVWAHFF